MISNFLLKQGWSMIFLWLQELSQLKVHVQAVLALHVMPGVPVQRLHAELHVQMPAGREATANLIVVAAMREVQVANYSPSLNL